MEADVFPAYGHKNINTVTAADVRQLMIAVEKRDARDVAKRIHETTSQFFRFAIARDIATRNPASEFRPKDILAETHTENRARVDARELPELLVKINGYTTAICLGSLIFAGIKMMSGNFQQAIPALFGTLFGAGVLGWGAGWIGSLTGQSMQGAPQ